MSPQSTCQQSVSPYLQGWECHNWCLTCCDGNNPGTWQVLIACPSYTTPSPTTHLEDLLQPSNELHLLVLPGLGHKGKHGIEEHIIGHFLRPETGCELNEMAEYDSHSLIIPDWNPSKPSQAKKSKPHCFTPVASDMCQHVCVGMTSP